MTSEPKMLSTTSGGPGGSEKSHLRSTVKCPAAERPAADFGRPKSWCPDFFSSFDMVSH